VDLPTGYTGLVLQGDPQPTATAPGLNAEVKGGFEGEDEREEEEVDSGTKGGRRTRSKGKGSGKGKVKEPTKKTAAPKGRLARTAAPKRPAEPEVITVDDQDQEMAEPKAPTTEPPLPPATAEITDCHSQNLELTNDDIDCLDNDLDEGMPLRKLIPQSTFSSITLWHADRAVDETRDEYYRTLTEWMALNHEIHRTDL